MGMDMDIDMYMDMYVTCAALTIHVPQHLHAWKVELGGGGPLLEARACSVRVGRRRRERAWRRMRAADHAPLLPLPPGELSELGPSTCLISAASVHNEG
jgi:hypothetical protein